MILDAKIMARRGEHGMLVDASTGQPVRWAQWANMETGEYRAFKVHPAQVRALRALGRPLAEMIFTGRAGHLRFIPFAPRAGKPKKHTREELAALAREARRGEPTIMTEGQECDEPKCHKLACWRVSDEQQIESAIGKDGKEKEQAITIKVRRYCSRHYRFPTFCSLRGVESETIVKARPE